MKLSEVDTNNLDKKMIFEFEKNVDQSVLEINAFLEESVSKSKVYESFVLANLKGMIETIEHGTEDTFLSEMASYVSKAVVSGIYLGVELTNEYNRKVN